MMMRKRGSILILSLWTVALMSLLAVHIGLRVRQRISLLSRIEQRSQMRFMAQAGVKKAIAVLRSDLERNGFLYTAYGKYLRHNDPERFQEVGLGQGQYSVQYPDVDGKVKSGVVFGFTDEESRININYVPVHVLSQLIKNVALIDEEEAQGIAEAIVDWRTFGRSQTTGFYSDDYYYNLEYPYAPKDMEFEHLDEWLLVRGVTADIGEKLKPFFTIYGDGRININTASAAVLEAAGLSPQLIDKMFQVRRGLDGIEATVDDHVFLKTFDLASEISGYITLTPEEIKQIDSMNDRDLFKLNSVFYRIVSVASLTEGVRTMTVECVYNASENRIESWREK